MSDHTSIEWADATWNPVVGCSVVSPGCTNCYAMRLANRLLDKPGAQYAGTTQRVNGNAVWTGKVALAPDHILTQPMRWKRPRRIFVNSMGDLFHEGVPDAWIDRAFAVMALCPQHTFLVLTKRAARMREYFTANTGEFDTGHACGRIADAIQPMRTDNRAVGPVPHLHGGERWWPLANVWLGVSAEDQQRADERIPDLLATPAVKRFVSCEPLLGPIRFREVLGDDWLASGRSGEARGLDWVIVGGESGPGARPMHPDWVRALRDQCGAAGVPFFFKQWGEWLPWEPEHGPCWVAQNGRSEDHHNLFPVEIDEDPAWDDGLWALDGNTGHAAFQRVGKSRAGRLLDGREWNEVPG